MKLHLPTALRHALLAITALLSPAVVTTTFATATLAAITAPTMAADLTLNADSNAFDTNLTVEKIELASGVTSATLEPDRSTITTLTVTADSICLASDQTLRLVNAKIIANQGIETLLTNVAGEDCVFMSISSIWGSGGSSANDVLLSSFINKKLRRTTQAYVHITKGHIRFDVGFDDLGCYLGDGESEDSGSVSATISSELESLKFVDVASDATLDLGSDSKGFTLNIHDLKGTVKTGRDLTLTGNRGWGSDACIIYSSSSVCVEENSEASITLDKVELMGGSVSAHNIILKDVTAYNNYESTLTATNELQIQGNIELKNTIVHADSTIIADGQSLTLGTGKFTTGAVTIGAGATLDLGSSTTNLKGIITNNGTLVLGGTITVDDTAFIAGTRERYSADNNGYKITETTYTVLTGDGAVTGTATWKVGTQSATYENGMVIVGIEDTAVYYVRNGDVAYTRALANGTTTFRLDGGHLELNESLKDTQSIEWKSTASWLNINNAAVELKSSQLSTVSAGNFTLIAPNGGTYIIDKKVGDIVELTLGTGVTLSDEHWWGWVKTVGDTTVSSDLDTTSWKNTELNGTTTVNSGVTLTLGGNTTLGGKITNGGTLNLQGSIMVDTTTFNPSDAVKEVTGYVIGDSTTPNSTKSGFEAACWNITIAEGGTIDGTGATWKLKGDDDATFDFESDGTLHAYGSSVDTIFHVAQGDTITYSDRTLTHFTNSEREAATGIQLDGGTLKLEKALGTTSDDFVKAAIASKVEISNGVTLNAAQLDASAAPVTLSGSGSYTLEDGANTLGEGVNVGTDWTGTVNTTGDTSALELSSLGNALSSIDLGSFTHTLDDGEHVINSALVGSGSLKLNEGSRLTLNGDCSKWSGNIIGKVELELTEGGTIGGNVQVDSLLIGESSTTFIENLTTAGTITVSENATLSLSQTGNTTLGGKISNSGTLVLGGHITIDSSKFAAAGDVTTINPHYQQGSSAESMTSGFISSSDGMTIKVVTGNSANATGANWSVTGVTDGSCIFDAASGELHVVSKGSVGTAFYINTGDAITYDNADAAFKNINGQHATELVLNGGNLVLSTELLDSTMKITANEAGSVEIGSDAKLYASQLNASQLAASADKVRLSGEGAYTLESGANTLGEGVIVGTGWRGTVYTGSTAQGAALNITALGNSQSTVYLGAQPMRRSMPEATVLESLTAAGVGTTETPGSLTLQKGESTADALVVNGILTLGSADAAAYLNADSVSLQELNFAHADSRLKTNTLILKGSTSLNVQLTDEVLSNTDAGKTLELLELANGFGDTLTFNGSSEIERVRSGDNRKEYTLAWNEAGTVLTLTILGTETYVTEQVAPTTHNGRAGVALMTDVFLNSSPQKDAPDGALAGILNAVDAGTTTDRDMAAVAGASTAALGMALSGDVERQLRAIRNRSLAGNDAATVTLVDEKSGLVSMEAPARFFAWVNAEGNRAEQNADSTAAGYTLTSWGGTLGAGMQVNDQLTLGLALTAMYGNLQSDGPDYLKGDMDTTYVSAFARYESGKWSHAFIGTAGTMEADYKRSAMSYSTDGDTDGTAFGLMYEVSRSMQLSNRSTLSPVVNISYRHTEVDSYSESGADAALNVGKQSMDTVTLGAGARYAAVVGQQTLNRACGFEARALVKYDLGDRQSTPSTGFTGYATRAGIESAELGAFGVELGAGISVPAGSGSIFADGAVELRSDYTNFNAAVGYRVQF